MIAHESERLSAYLDGELRAAEAEELERHIEECFDCRRVLAELREVRARSGALPDLLPASDLWSGIATRIESMPQADLSSLQVIDLRTRRASRLSKRIAITLPQLAAASIVLMLLSGSAVWFALKGSQPAAVALDYTGQSVRMVSMGPDQVTDYTSAVRALENALRQQRDRLDPVTVAILEENIRAIDTAITEAEAALERDPGSLYLNQHLDNTMKQKIQLLRRATGLPNSRI
ncbi:MAG: zf-HC2 domain-containing protein [Gemmatimonadota bacterium]